MSAKSDIPHANEFRQRLKQFRDERFGWTQSDLAEHAQVSVVTISKLEQGKNLPTFEVLVALCSALKVSPDELIGWSKDASTPAAVPLATERMIKALAKMSKGHAEAVLELAEELAKG